LGNRYEGIESKEAMNKLETYSRGKMMGEWHNCYDDGWQGLIVPEAFAHP